MSKPVLQRVTPVKPVMPTRSRVVRSTIHAQSTPTRSPPQWIAVAIKVCLISRNSKWLIVTHATNVHLNDTATYCFCGWLYCGCAGPQHQGGPIAHVGCNRGRHNRGWHTGVTSGGCTQGAQEGCNIRGTAQPGIIGTTIITTIITTQAAPPPVPSVDDERDST